MELPLLAMSFERLPKLLAQPSAPRSTVSSFPSRFSLPAFKLQRERNGHAN